MRSMSGDVSSLVASMDTNAMQLSEMHAILEGSKEQRDQSASGSHTDVISEEALSLLEGKLVSQMEQLGEAIEEVSVTVKGLQKAIEKGKKSDQEAAEAIREAVREAAAESKSDTAVLLEAMRTEFGGIKALDSVFPLLDDLKGGQQKIIAAVGELEDELRALNKRMSKGRIDAEAAAAELSALVSEAADAASADHEAVMAELAAQYGELVSVNSALSDLQQGQAKLLLAVAGLEDEMKALSIQVKKGRKDSVAAAAELKFLVADAAKEASADSAAVLRAVRDQYGALEHLQSVFPLLDELKEGPKALKVGQQER
jgi:chromosome segregation ATPase